MGVGKPGSSGNDSIGKNCFMDADMRVGEIWLGDEHTPQMLRGMLIVRHGNGCIEFCPLGIGRIRLRREDMQPPPLFA